MKEDIKKITIQSNFKKSKLSPKKDTIKKLANEPEAINSFIKDKVNELKHGELTSWIVPSFFSKKTIEENPNKIESIIQDIQIHRKTNQILSKKQNKKIEKDKKNEHGPKKQKGGRIKSKKEGRIYTKKELRDLHKTLIKLYEKGESRKITNILKRLTKNQCNQILSYKKLIKRSWTNAPLPLLRFLVYQSISYPSITYNIAN